jgi:hypothetical protein
MFCLALGLKKAAFPAEPGRGEAASQEELWIAGWKLCCSGSSSI